MASWRRDSRASAGSKPRATERTHAPWAPSRLRGGGRRDRGAEDGLVGIRRGVRQGAGGRWAGAGCGGRAPARGGDEHPVGLEQRPQLLLSGLKGDAPLPALHPRAAAGVVRSHSVRSIQRGRGGRVMCGVAPCGAEERGDVRGARVVAAVGRGAADAPGGEGRDHRACRGGQGVRGVIRGFVFTPFAPGCAGAPLSWASSRKTLRRAMPAFCAAFEGKRRR